MKFSIIIPVFNKEKFIVNTIESVLNQSYNNLELLVIDDHSSDQSFNLIKSKFDDDRIRLFQTLVNSGPGAARNVGLKNSTGDSICFLDADDYYDIHYLKNLHQTYSSYKNCNIIITSRCFLSNNTRYPKIEKIKNALKHTADKIYKIENIIDLLKIEVLLGSNGTISVSRDICNHTFFGENETNFEDWAFFLPIVLKNRNTIYFNENAVFYYNDLQENNLSKRKITAVEQIEFPLFLKILKNDFNELSLFRQLFTFWIYSVLTRTDYRNRLQILLKFKNELIKYTTFNPFFLKIVYRLLIP